MLRSRTAPSHLLTRHTLIFKSVARDVNTYKMHLATISNCLSLKPTVATSDSCDAFLSSDDDDSDCLRRLQVLSVDELPNDTSRINSCSSTLKCYSNAIPPNESDRKPEMIEDEKNSFSSSEFWSYQFWKCARTELVASLLFALIVSHASISARLESPDIGRLQVQLVAGGVQAAVVAMLTQLFGHISGCHLSAGVTLALFVKGLVSWRRLLAYGAAQVLGALFGVELLELASSGAGQPSLLALSLPQPDSEPQRRCLAQTSGELRRLVSAGECIATNGGQMFALQLVASVLVVLTFLVNADRRRVDAGFRALSIGVAHFVACVLCAHADGFFASPAHFGALALLADVQLPSHWVSRLFSQTNSETSSRQLIKRLSPYGR